MGMALSASVCAGAESAEVNLDYVAQRALERAQQPFHSPRADLPKVLRQENLDYDKYREIEFRHDRALWLAEGLPFRVEFFHPGYFYQEPVHVNEFTSDLRAADPVRAGFFQLPGAAHPKPDSVQHRLRGIQVLNQLNEPNKWDELGSFLGASYFRLLGKDQRYGSSARGLAHQLRRERAGGISHLHRLVAGQAAAGRQRSGFVAILDSVSCTGAYEFDIHPGDNTVADVTAELFFREPEQIHAADTNARPIQTIGLAPLSSMFWFGKNSERKFDDYRPEVHDTDGLLANMDSGEILWRPLDDPAAHAPPGFSRAEHPRFRPAPARAQFCRLIRTRSTFTSRCRASGWSRAATGATATCISSS